MSCKSMTKHTVEDAGVRHEGHCSCAEPQLARLTARVKELEALLKNAGTGAMRAVYTRDTEDPK